MSNQEIQSVFDRFSRLRVMVIGDVMVDAYIFGKVERISPEAPVPVVSVEQRVNRLGGAANVALNLKSLGAEPVLCSVIGNDSKGIDFMNLLAREEIAQDAILTSTERITTTKYRIIGNKSQMLRVDEEVTTELNADDRSMLLEKITGILQGQKIDAIIFQDYDKGVLTKDVISKVTDLATGLKIPVAVDPKRRNFLNYRGATLFKPNFKELREGLNYEINPDRTGELNQAAIRLHREYEINTVMVTLSDRGIFISRNRGDGGYDQKFIPAHIRKISDVSGAGDTVISVATLGLAAHLDSGLMAALANLAGGLVCEEVGVQPVSRLKLMSEAEMLF